MQRYFGPETAQSVNNNKRAKKDCLPIPIAQDNCDQLLSIPLTMQIDVHNKHDSNYSPMDR